MRGMLRSLAVLFLGVLGVPALVVLSGTGSAHPPAGQISARAKLAPAVLEQTSEGRRASLIVLMAEQADLSAAPSISDPGARGRYVYRALREHADRSQRDLRSSLDGLGVAYEPLWAANALIVRGDRSIAEMLTSRNDVGAIELNSPFRTNYYIATAGGETSNAGADAIEWGVQSVNAPQVWALGYTGQGIVIGNAGTGVRWEHDALKPHYRGWNGAAADHNYNWWDAVHSSSGPCGANSQAPCDDIGHSTHTTGTAVGDDAGGNQIGVAPGATWIGCRNMDQGSGTPQRFIECFQFFLAPTDLNGQNPDPARRPHIINASWSCQLSAGCAPDTLQQVVQSAEAAGIFVDTIAGSYGPDCSTVQDPPGIYGSAFTVGAYSSNNTLAGFSGRGPVTVDGSMRRKPDVVGPGVNVRSAYNSGNSSYTIMSGVSMAAPHLAGAVALLWSARPQLVRDIAATRALFESSANPNVIVNTGPTVCGGIPYTQIPNNHFGYGRVDALAAVNQVGKQTATPTGTATRTATPTNTPVNTPSPVVTQECRPWERVASADVITASQNLLFGVSAVSPSDAWAVGVYNVGTYSEALLEHWDGSAWRIVPAPAENVILNDVKALSNNDAWAVGNAILHWDGAQWNSAASLAGGLLAGVDGVAAGDVWAVGSANGRTLTMHWNGSTWSTIPSPNVGTGENSLLAVAAVSGSEVWAVGSYAGSSGRSALVLRWTGSEWVVVPSPNPGAEDAYLVGVAAIAPHDVWAVGNYWSSENRRLETFSMRWDGNAWSLVPSPNPGGLREDVAFTGVAASPAGDLWAAGSYFDNSLGRTQALLTLWDGSRWSLVPGPVANTEPVALRSIAAEAPGVVWAVGDRFSTQIWTLTLHYGGGITFTDVLPTDYFYDSVNFLYCGGVVSGYADNSFRPYSNTTRAQLTKIVTLAEGWLLYTPPAPSFSDVPVNHTFYAYIETAYRQGVISGYSDGTFRPFNNVTRGQLCKIVVLARTWQLYIPPQPTFADVPPSHTFHAYIETTYSHSIISGYNCGTGCLEFRPQNNATRGQISKIVHNAVTPPQYSR